MPQSTPARPTAHHDVLLNLIVAFLAPMFLSVCAGDITFARKAAIEMVNAYRARHHADLLTIAQIIGFGLAALGSLSQSMAEDIPLSMSLRLQANANALNRSAEQNRRALTARQAVDPTPHRDEPTHAAPLADAGVRDPEPAAAAPGAPANTRVNAERLAAVSVPASNPAEKSAGKRHQELWAIAMIKEAQKITASIPSLPQAERQAATNRAAALSCTANELLTGASTPPHGPAGK